MEVLELIYKKHNDWILIVQSFGCNKDTAEDIVMEAYIKLDKMIKSGVNIMYNEKEINYYYVYRTLTNLFIDLKRKESKILVINLEDVQNTLETDHIDNLTYICEQIEIEKNKLYWYDRKVYDIISEGVSITKLSQKSKISYYSLYNTYRKVEKHLKEHYKKNFKDI